MALVGYAVQGLFKGRREPARIVQFDIKMIAGNAIYTRPTTLKAQQPIWIGHQ